MRHPARRRARRVFSLGAGVLLLGIVGGGPWGGPWSASEPTEFVVEPGLLARLQTLADGLHNEIVLCLEGPVRGGVAYADHFEMPTPRESSPMRSSFDPCPDGTLASWHNHPTSNRSADAGRSVGAGSPSRAQRLCVLSETDIATAGRLRYPFVVVAVDAETWCWWTLAEVDAFAEQSIVPGPPAPGRIASRATVSSWSKPGNEAGEAVRE